MHDAVRGGECAHLVYVNAGPAGNKGDVRAHGIPREVALPVCDRVYCQGAVCEREAFPGERHASLGRGLEFTR